MVREADGLICSSSPSIQGRVWSVCSFLVVYWDTLFSDRRLQGGVWSVCFFLVVYRDTLFLVVYRVECGVSVPSSSCIGTLCSSIVVHRVECGLSVPRRLQGGVWIVCSSWSCSGHSVHRSSSTGWSVECLFLVVYRVECGVSVPSWSCSGHSVHRSSSTG